MSAIAQPASGRISDETPSPMRDWHLLFRLAALLMPYLRFVLASLFCALLTMALQIFNPLILSVAIDVYLLHRQPEATLSWLKHPDQPAHGLTFLSLLFLATLVFTLLSESSQAFLVQWTGQRVMADLRRQLSLHLQSLPIRYYDTTPAGRIVTRVTTDVEALSDLFSNGIVTVLANLLMMVFFLVAMFCLNVSLAGTLAAVLPPFIALTIYFRRTIARSQQRVRILLARINSFIAEHISGISVVQLFNRERLSLAQFECINSQHRDASKEWVIGNAWFLPATEFLGALSLAGLLFASGWLLHHRRVSVGTLVAFLLYSSRFLKPIQEISERFSTFQTSLASAQKVFELLDLPAAANVRGNIAAERKTEALRFDSVWFAYQKEQWVLQDVSFKANAGEMLAIVGHTGAGKTTLMNLLLRFYEPQRGSIHLGANSIGDLDLTELRAHFGIVLQDSYVHEGTVLENIRFGSEMVTDEAACRAAHEVGLDDALRHLEGGLSARVQERGENLSSGQKQLIAFARALAHEPRYLILDEATSHIDLETETRIQAALGRILRGRTSIVIAHRLSTVVKADRIIVLHHGRVAETGSHKNLVAQRGLYWRLCQMQFGMTDAHPTPGHYVQA